jgi:hypothetical protein
VSVAVLFVELVVWIGMGGFQAGGPANRGEHGKQDTLEGSWRLRWDDYVRIRLGQEDRLKKTGHAG